jgi:NADH dehydrogenase [ubiquinone] 1 alpha subcomplex assembly factor 7
MGIDVRVDALKKAAKTEERKDDIDKAAKRLVDLNGMGSQYKVLGITSAMNPSQPTEGVWPFVKLDLHAS